jgi:hypothetical protein
MLITMIYHCVVFESCCILERNVFVLFFEIYFLILGILQKFGEVKIYAPVSGVWAATQVAELLKWKFQDHKIKEKGNPSSWWITVTSLREHVWTHEAEGMQVTLLYFEVEEIELKGSKGEPKGKGKHKGKINILDFRRGEGNKDKGQQGQGRGRG